MINKKHSLIQGFTLTDLLISIAIISLISSVVLFNVSEGKVKAEDAKMKTESGQVATAIEIYKTSNNGKTPIAHLTESGVPLTSNATTGVMYDESTPQFVEVMNKLIETGYLSAIPKSPDGSSCAYGESADGTEAVFAARLRSSRNISGNTRNSCSTAQSFNNDGEGDLNIPQIPACDSAQVGWDIVSRQAVYSQTCQPMQGLQVVCSNVFQELWVGEGELPSKGTEIETEWVQVYWCGYQIESDPEPSVPPLCSGGNEEDYCTCI